MDTRKQFTPEFRREAVAGVGGMASTVPAVNSTE